MAQRKHLLVVYADDFPFLPWSNACHGIGTLGDPTLMPQTPFLDSLVAGGVRWRHFRASPVCSTGRASLLTADYPSRHGVPHVIKADYCGELAETGDAPFSAPWFFPTLGAHGIGTSHVGKVHHGLADSEVIPAGPRAGEYGSGWRILDRLVHPTTHLFAIERNLNQIPTPGGQSFQGGYYSYFANRSSDPATREECTDYNTARLFTEAGAFWRALPAWKRGCQMICLNGTHTPFGIQGDLARDFPPDIAVLTQAYKDARDLGLASAWEDYLAAAEAVDYYFEAFYRGLPSWVRQNLSILFLADNGPDGALLESGALHGKTYPTVNLGRCKGSLYLHGTRVDAVWKGPGVPQPGREALWQADLVDVPVTACNYFGLGGAVPLGVHGQNFLPTLDDAAAGPWARTTKRVLYGQLSTPLGSWKQATTKEQSGVSYLPAIGAKPSGEYHLIRRLGAQDELYRLRDEAGDWVDPNETVDLAGDSSWSQVLSAMHSRIDEVQP